MGLELLVWCDSAWLAENLTLEDFLTLQSAHQRSEVITSLTPAL